MTARVFRYVVRFDGGSAPNPFGGWCSLAICKPQIRRTARVGDWIMGLRSKRVDHLIYAMCVEEVLSFSEYWNDPRFANKKPDKDPCCDNIYKPDEYGRLIWVENHVHDEGSALRDLSGEKVLVGQKFWYFGQASPQIPTDIVHLIHDGVGYSVNKRRKETDIEVLEKWLRYWGQGVHGKPIDRQLDFSTLLDVPITSRGCQQC
jgi:hypothetical protein